MFELTLDKAKELVLKAIEEKGEDYIYENPDGLEWCNYVHGDVPGCLVGHVLFNAGVSLDWMSQHEGNSAPEVISRASREGLISIDGSVQGFLTNIQEWQDNQETWGESYRYAVECL